MHASPRCGRLPLLLIFWAASGAGLFAAPGDMDGDRAFDVQDYALWRPCMMGPGQPVLDAACRPARFDADLDVDLLDFAAFHAVFASACTGTLSNDPCRCSLDAAIGTTGFSNVAATTDGPDEPGVCEFFGQSQVYSDIWYCYTAECSGTVFVSLCGSDYDTKIAVYAGCACPTAAAIACSDDDCGTGVGYVQSRVQMNVLEGERYLIRIGGYLNERGGGLLSIGCNADACGAGEGDCFAPSSTASPGCGDVPCCQATCALDQACCDVSWDTDCAAEAHGVCGEGFPACTPMAGPCGAVGTAPGCNDAACCNTVCVNDPYCCLIQWDGFCVDEAEAACFLTCVPTAGDCLVTHASPGCSDEACCREVCARDAYCCSEGWDDACAHTANGQCR